MITLEFFACLLVGTLVYWRIPGQRGRAAFLSLLSLAFIAYYDRWAALVVVLLSGYGYLAGAVIAKTRSDLYHRLSIIVLVLMLGAFKYVGFLERTLTDIAHFINFLPTFHIEHLILPLGLSYLTFKLISYLTDIHWKILTPGTYLEVLCYCSLFTIFVAGPIERFSQFVPQLRSMSGYFSWKLAESGTQRIAIGLFKKLVLADWISYFIAPVWEHPDAYSWSLRALGLLGFSFQIYLDFAGYSDMAIGASRFFGFTIMENFDWPYMQPNISLFWQHWHISLSSWIRDYIFFPLSRASRGTVWNLAFVPLIAMAISGLWHGAAWHFVLWGLWLGVGIAGLQIWNRRKRAHPRLKALADSRAFTYASTLVTFLFVTVGWLWFRG